VEAASHVWEWIDRLEALTGRSLERVDHLVEWSFALLAREVLPRDTAT
jgi:DNA-binding PucR family transcriptional regulator